MFPLDLKGRFYATLAVLYIMGTFYARYFGAYLPLCLNISYYNIIKGRLYANHIMSLSGVKASLYDTKQTQGRVLCATKKRRKFSKEVEKTQRSSGIRTHDHRSSPSSYTQPTQLHYNTNPSSPTQPETQTPRH